MKLPAIEAEDLGKRYRLGDDVGKNQLADLFRPWRKSNEANDFWALRDVSFKIEQGESIGIVGRNGAGKSTLLKILSRITAPTTGRAVVRGRVGTLLEVGTGFHPELSGRDNIFLSGTILGMSYGSVKRKLDEIIAFSEVGQFIDTPVKRYSSGMQVKLAFAVALYLEPEILIVDEVLAVGDIAFQRKSIGRLKDVTGREGRTVLFVSHSLDAVRRSCERVIVLQQGQVRFDGPTEEGIEFYRKSVPFEAEQIKTLNIKNRNQRTSGEARFTKIECLSVSGSNTWVHKVGETVKFEIGYEVSALIPDLYLLFRIITVPNDLEGRGETIVANIWIKVSDEPVSPGRSGVFEVVLPDLKLRPGEFTFYICLGQRDERVFYDVMDANVELPVLVVKSESTVRADRLGLVSLDYRFTDRVLAPVSTVVP
jgi:lipopolysaccharide transport system ATP-binding protein